MLPWALAPISTYPASQLQAVPLQQLAPIACLFSVSIVRGAGRHWRAARRNEPAARAGSLPCVAHGRQLPEGGSSIIRSANKLYILNQTSFSNKL